jgi:hypothetical protein
MDRQIVVRTLFIKKILVFTKQAKKMRVTTKKNAQGKKKKGYNE